MKVLLAMPNREEATRILSTILAETDRLIRYDERRDAWARIRDLGKQLKSRDMGSYERQTLIDILTQQEQFFTILQADKRFAIKPVAPSYSPAKPFSPRGLLFMTGIGALLGLILWTMLVLTDAYFTRGAIFPQRKF